MTLTPTGHRLRSDTPQQYMTTISTIDKFRGSLIGAYIGHYASERCSAPWPPIETSSLYKAWLTSISQNRRSQTPSKASLSIAIPWLLSCHDDINRRLHWLNQTLAAPAIHQAANENTLQDTIGALYILGDCLEWLMQCSANPQYLAASLWPHLQYKQSTYPSKIRPRINQCMEEILTTQPSVFIPQSTGNGNPLMTVTLAIRCCLNHPENLALALTTPGMTVPTATLVGCLLGAWNGASIIPVGWLMAINQDSRKALDDIAQQLYGHWAGISHHVTANLEVFPLDF